MQQSEKEADLMLIAPATARRPRGPIQEQRKRRRKDCQHGGDGVLSLPGQGEKDWDDRRVPDQPTGERTF